MHIEGVVCALRVLFLERALQRARVAWQCVGVVGRMPSRMHARAHARALSMALQHPPAQQQRQRAQRTQDPGEPRRAGARSRAGEQQPHRMQAETHTHTPPSIQATLAVAARAAAACAAICARQATPGGLPPSQPPEPCQRLPPGFPASLARGLRCRGCCCRCERARAPASSRQQRRQWFSPRTAGRRAGAARARALALPPSAAPCCPGHPGLSLPIHLSPCAPTQTPSTHAQARPHNRAAQSEAQ